MNFLTIFKPNGSENRLRNQKRAGACCGGGKLPDLEPERVIALVFLAATLVAPRLLHAQAEPAGIGPGSYTSVGITASAVNSGYGQQRLSGATLYVDGNLYRRVGFEAEARILGVHADQNLRQSTYLAGARFSARGYNVRPYTKLLAGVGFMTFPFNDAHGRYLVLAPGGGLDYRVRHSGLQLRVLDVEYQYWPQFTFGAMRSWAISTGLSLRVW